MKKISFEKGLERLEEIAAGLDSGELDLQNAINLYQEGTELSSTLEDMLNKAERSVYQSVNSNDKSAEKVEDLELFDSSS
ncbi:MAG: exodeoxyribonuclease VII small subunit [Spirochaetes bacterium]|nr:exodeoxyribonuclease VII small subunit [Spirochaetota bacterium]